MKKSVAVLGLGKFGSSIARSLAKGGAEVLAVDKDEDLVRDIADKVTCAVCVDISDKEMMNNIGLEGMDAVRKKALSLHKIFTKKTWTRTSLVY